MTTRHDCLGLDARDELAPLRDLFDLPDGTIYLDGNSLGALPRATAVRVQQVAAAEWGRDLIKSWNTAGWIDLPQRIGDKIALLLGAGPGELIVADSTSVNLFKALSAALDLAQRDTPGRQRIVSERFNFPTDLYIAESLARQRGFELVLADADEIPALIDDRLAVLMLTHVNYRTGRMHRMEETNLAVHAAGALAVWDLAHSAGAVPVNLKGSGPRAGAADFAVGCGYKYLNGGPGAPAFVWMHPTIAARMDAEQLWQPLSGWLGHAAPFMFTPDYHPAAGIARFVCGTPPVLSLAALECGVDTMLAAEAHGGQPALRRKSIALTELFIALVEARCAGHGLALQTPRDAAQRGSQASFARADGGYAIMQALIARGVIGDFRAPDLLRFGFTPLYTRFVDVWDAVEHLAQVLQTGEWQQARFNQRAAVT
ncbi:kynureninase [Rhizobacter sp. SG703]|uniref:kynureninase n=1 Tax=Rhizobacter sp. SG703 TaxID=2587140 RepID=UPI001446F6B8|nr:kynureninase [Rhizobacter sp. SG703]NKI93017.1 kynureninase [Rhizobacter sp. SG703]